MNNPEHSPERVGYPRKLLDSERPQDFREARDGLVNEIVLTFDQIETNESIRSKFAEGSGTQTTVLAENGPINTIATEFAPGRYISSDGESTAIEIIEPEAGGSLSVKTARLNPLEARFVGTTVDSNKIAAEFGEEVWDSTGRARWTKFAVNVDGSVTKNFLDIDGTNRSQPATPDDMVAGASLLEQIRGEL